VNLDEEHWIMVGEPTLAPCDQHPNCCKVSYQARVLGGDGTVQGCETHLTNAEVMALYKELEAAIADAKRRKEDSHE
jgi:hypothetical protein